MDGPTPTGSALRACVPAMLLALAQVTIAPAQQSTVARADDVSPHESALRTTPGPLSVASSDSTSTTNGVAVPVPAGDCADDRSWYAAGTPITLDGRPFRPLGSPEPISSENLLRIGTRDGVGLYVGRLAKNPYVDLWLPVCDPAGHFRLYTRASESD